MLHNSATQLQCYIIRKLIEIDQAGNSEKKSNWLSKGQQLKVIKFIDNNAGQHFGIYFSRARELAFIGRANISITVTLQ